MKPVKNLVFAALLVFSIALNSFAGDIDLPGSPAPAPPPPRATVVTSDTNTDDQQTVETADYPWFEVLTALLSVY
jgi:hypothetical protein